MARVPVRAVEARGNRPVAKSRRSSPRPRAQRRSLKDPCRADDVAVAAVAYAGHGWRVLPLHTIRDGVCTCSAGAACNSPGKHPLRSGVHEATSDIEAVRRIWKAHPDANVGIAAGRASGLIALDVDPRNGGDDTFRRLLCEAGALPRTITADTGGGGFHRLFRHPDVPTRTRHRSDGLPGLDFQSDGSYIVAPPSRHASGQRYRWRQDRDPASLRLAALPANWLARLQDAAASPPSPSPAPEPDAIAEGRRNTHLTSRAGALRQAGLSQDAILAALRVENAERCRPPLDEAEVATIAASIGRYAPGTTTPGDEAEWVMQAVLDHHYGGGAHLLYLPDGQFWAFDGSCWAPLSVKVLHGVILSVIQAQAARRAGTASLMRQVATLIEARVAASGDPLRFTAPPLPVLNCRNGELWLAADGSAELRPHSATSYLRHRLDVDYDPDATCPTYDATLIEIFAKSDDPEAMADFWDELMGYAAQADRRETLVVIGLGQGNNGKTRLLMTYVRLVGANRVVATAIAQIEKNRFLTGSLLGKLAVIDDDVRAGTRLPDGDLKRLSEEKTVTGENKFGPLFTFTARTAIFMLCNGPPSLADLSHGMQRRLVVVPFTRRFGPKETDKGLFPRIWADEMPGVLNRYLAGLRRVIARGWGFAPPAAVEQAKVALLSAANPVPAFVEERCERSGSAYVQELYEAYKAWAEGAGVTIVPQRLAFQRTLENLGFTPGRGSQGPKLHGLRLRPAPAAPWPRRPSP